MENAKLLADCILRNFGNKICFMFFDANYLIETSFLIGQSCLCMRVMIMYTDLPKQFHFHQNHQESNYHFYLTNIHNF